MQAKLVDTVLAIAEGAGEILLSRYGRQSLAVSDKVDGSPVTDADLSADRYIRAALAEASAWPIISEESPLPEPAVRDAWRRFWLVDPLDGTKEFVQGTGEFCTVIALVEDGEPVLGVITAPMLGTSWLAVRGEGAERVDAEGRRPLRGPRREGPLVALRSRFHARPEADAYVAKVGVDETRVVGSAVKYGLFADGEADLLVSYSRSSWWDVAAGQCVVEASGGAFLRLDDQQPPTYRGASVTNPPFLVCSPRLRLRAFP
jgi:3'(2'), 5'-bisphosphate nucleotidase